MPRTHGPLGPAILVATVLLVAVSGAQDQPEPPGDQDPPPPPPPEQVLPEVHTDNLANGVKLYFLEDHELPLVTVDVLFRAGGMDDPTGRKGLARLVGRCMRSGGTRTRTGEELNRALEDLAVELELSIGETSGSARVSCLAENLQPALEMLVDVLRNPAFPEEGLERVREQLRVEIAHRNDEPRAAAERELRKLVYGSGHPLARQPEMADLDAIGREDVVGFHRSHFVPSAIHLGVSGDFDTAQVRSALEKLLGDWPRGTVTWNPVPEPRPRPGVYVVDLPGLPNGQAVVRMGHPVGRQNLPDHPYILLMNHLLGGGTGTSRLFDELRSRRGLVSSVWSAYLPGYEFDGMFMAGCETPAKDARECIQALLDQIGQIRREEATPEDLQRAREQMKSSDAFDSDSPEKILSRAMVYGFHSYPPDSREKVLAALQRASPADVLEAARTYLRPDALVILVAGDPEILEPELVKLGRGPSQLIDVTIPVPGTSTETIDFESPAAQNRGRELARLSVTSQGGARLIQETTSLNLEMEMVPEGHPEAASLRRRVVQIPDRLRDETATPSGPLIQILNGDLGVLVAGDQRSPLPPERIAALKAEVAGITRPPLLRAAEGEIPCAAGGYLREQDRRVQIVGIQDPDEGPLLFYIDVETGDALRRISLEAGSRIEAIYSDYREVDGRRVSFRRKLVVDGQPRFDVKITSVAFNQEIDPTLFELP